MSTMESDDEIQSHGTVYPSARIAAHLRPLDQLLGYATEGFTLRELYFGPLKPLLATVAARLAAYESQEVFPEIAAASLVEALETLEQAIPDGFAMADLMRTPAAQWPGGVAAASEALYALGFLLPWNHVPDAEKAAVAHLFDQRKFTDTLGRYTLRDLYAKAKTDATPRERHVIRIGRAAGVLRRHAARPFSAADPIVSGDKNDMACYQGNCYHRLDCYCEMASPPYTGCSVMSDPWDPYWDPPI